MMDDINVWHKVSDTMYHERAIIFSKDKETKDILFLNLVKVRIWNSKETWGWGYYKTFIFNNKFNMKVPKVPNNSTSKRY